MVALLVAGGAISLLISCGGAAEGEAGNDEAIVSRTVRDMEVISSENGQKSNLLRSPLVEEHAFAKDAYEEHPRGIEVIGYDSIGRPSSRVVADYALHWTARDLWELNGNVLVEGEDGQKLYTQQLRWDRKIKKIYSNVDCKVEQQGDVMYGVGFEAADDFSRWRFLGVTGTVGVNVGAGASDSTAVENPPSLLTRPEPPGHPGPDSDSIEVEQTTPSASDAAAQGGELPARNPAAADAAAQGEELPVRNPAAETVPATAAPGPEPAADTLTVER